MKKNITFIQLVYILLAVSGSVFAVGERTITLGGEATWKNAENKTSVTEVKSIRPYPVLALLSDSGTSAAGYYAAEGVLGNLSAMSNHALDLYISFDERDAMLFKDSIGNYRVSASSGVEAADRLYSRAGTGAAVFNRLTAGSNPVVAEPAGRNALFAPGSRMRDFTIEFWMYPLNLENGEQIFSWVSSSQINGTQHAQRITCTASRNRMQWSFINFFTSANGSSHINIEFSGSTAVVPKTWSHHLIRFDASTGMLEYLVDGATEAIRYATLTGRENSGVYTPLAGNSGRFFIGENFSGLLDEFKIHSVFAGRSSIQRYNPQGGRMETKLIDLGEYSSAVIRIDVSGGRFNIRDTSGDYAGRNINAILNEFHENIRFRFSDDSEMNFFIRADDDPWLLNSKSWVNFTPGIDIAGVSGRYVQIAADFYPSSDGEASPYLDELRVIYLPGEPPLPPRNLTAVASDGAVTLRWRYSPDAYTEGYLVYYSAVRGELFGEGAAQGSSPVDVGMTNAAIIEGLRNGTLYYFRVAAYNRVTGAAHYNVGEFSAEVTARPLTGLSQ